MTSCAATNAFERGIFMNLLRVWCRSNVTPDRVLGFVGQMRGRLSMPKGIYPRKNSVSGQHRCWICKESKSLTEFNKDCTKSDGFGFLCKICNKEYKRKYHIDYKDRCRDSISKRRKVYYAANRETLLKKDKERRLKSGPKWASTQRAKHAMNPVPNMLQNAKTRARLKHLDFNLMIEDVVVPTLCPVLGIPLLVTSGRPTDNSPSLDRIDNSKGYIKDNVLVVSYRANTIKSNASLDELRLILDFYEKRK